MSGTKLSAAGWLALRDDIDALKKGHKHHSTKLREHERRIDGIESSVALRFAELAEAFRRHNELLQLLIEEVRLDRA